MQLRKVIGWMLVCLPFALIFFAQVYVRGWDYTLAVWAGALLIVALVVVGMKLAVD